MSFNGEIIIGSYMVLDDNPSELTEDAVEQNATEFSSYPNEIKYFWNYNATIMLISFIRDRFDDIYHPVRKRMVWNTIANDLANSNVEVTSKCCIQKWKSLQRTYKNTKNHTNTKFQFIDQMEELMTTKGADIINDSDLNSEEVKCTTAKARVKIQNNILRTASGARAAYFKEKCRYLNNKEKRKEKLLAQKLQFAEITVKLHEEMIDLQNMNLRLFQKMN